MPLGREKQLVPSVIIQPRDILDRHGPAAGGPVIAEQPGQQLAELSLPGAKLASSHRCRIDLHCQASIFRRLAKLIVYRRRLSSE